MDLTFVGAAEGFDAEGFEGFEGFGACPLKSQDGRLVSQMGFLPGSKRPVFLKSLLLALILKGSAGARFEMLRTYLGGRLCRVFGT